MPTLEKVNSCPIHKNLVDYHTEYKTNVDSINGTHVCSCAHIYVPNRHSSLSHKTKYEIRRKQVRFLLIYVKHIYIVIESVPLSTFITYGI